MSDFKTRASGWSGSLALRARMAEFLRDPTRIVRGDSGRSGHLKFRDFLCSQFDLKALSVRHDTSRTVESWSSQVANARQIRPGLASRWPKQRQHPISIAVADPFAKSRQADSLILARRSALNSLSRNRVQLYSIDASYSRRIVALD